MLHWLHAPTSAAPLAVFRMGFGALLFFSTLRFWWLGWIEDHYLDPLLHFKYWGFEWVEAPGAVGIYALHVVMLTAAVGVMVGYRYRWAAAALFFSFTYCELIDLTYYLNHYYFVSLTSALLVVLPAHRRASVDALRRPLPTDVPRWTVVALQLQLALVYFYAGTAKINADWLLHAQPLRLWLPAHDDLFLIGPWLREVWVAYAFSWAGMLYDLTIPFWLLWRPTRPWAYAAVIAFHVMTGILFQIGVFPLVMIVATWIFFPAPLHERILAVLSRIGRWTEEGRKTEDKGPRTEVNRQSAMGGRQSATRRPPSVLHIRPSVFSFKSSVFLPLLLFFLFQLLFPWRYLLYPGNVFWTEEGYRFAWRVMLMEKAGTATFYVRDGQTGREGVVVNGEFLNPHQEKQMSMQPDMILQFAHYLRDHYAARGVADPEVRAEVYVTLNGRPGQLLIDPHVNLAAEEDGWRPKPWIEPWSPPAPLLTESEASNRPL
ncbi:MAG: HTTM domain-containing protein [Catalinimonas sp.]